MEAMRCAGARRARELGLVGEVAPAEQLATRAREVADMIKRHSPTALMRSKQAIWGAAERGLTAGLEHAWSLIMAHDGHPDMAEGAQAFIVDHTPQPPRRRQGAGHRQQGFATGGAALGATQHSGGDVRHAAEAQAAFQHPIEAQELGGCGEQLKAFRATGRQRQGGAKALTGGGAGEARHVACQAGPLQKFKGLSGDGGRTRPCVPTSRAKDGALMSQGQQQHRGVAIGAPPQ